MVRQQPAFELLAHHRGGDFEMKRGQTAVVDRLWTELCFDGRGVIDDAQARPRRERPKVPRFLRRRRVMNELRGVTFDDSIRIMDAQLALIHQQSIRRWVAFK